MKLLLSDKIDDFLTHLLGLLFSLQQLTDQDSLQQINPFTSPSPLKSSSHSTVLDLASLQIASKPGWRHESLQ